MVFSNNDIKIATLTGLGESIFVWCSWQPIISHKTRDDPSVGSIPDDESHCYKLMINILWVAMSLRAIMNDYVSLFIRHYGKSSTYIKSKYFDLKIFNFLKTFPLYCRYSKAHILRANFISLNVFLACLLMSSMYVLGAGFIAFCIWGLCVRKKLLLWRKHLAIPWGMITLLIRPTAAVDRSKLCKHFTRYHSFNFQPSTTLLF